MKRITGILLILFVALLPLLERRMLSGSGWFFGAAVLLAAGALCAWPKNSPLRLGWADLGVGLWVFWCVIRTAFGSGTPDPGIAGRWGAVVACYLAVRLLRSPVTALLAAGTGALVQAAVIAGQITGWTQSHHTYFDVTGSFFNPGPLGGYLSVGAVCVLGLVFWCFCGMGRPVGRGLPDGAGTDAPPLCEREKRGLGKRWGVVAVIAFLLIVPGVILSDSRASWLGMFAGVALLAAAFFRAGKIPRRLKITFAFIAAGMITAGGCFLYTYKPASADGRLLIWRVSSGMIAERPLAGHGIGSFAGEYMFRQAAYFRAHPDSRYADVADNVYKPFNEAIGVWCEQGLVGLLLCLGVLAVLFFGRDPARPPGPGEKACRAGLLALLVFSLFSYPADITALAVLYGVLAGGIGSGKPLATFALPNRGRIIALALVLGTGAGLLVWMRSPSAIEHSQLKTHEYIVQGLGGEASCAELPELAAAVRRIPSSNAYTALGDRYLGCGDTLTAIASFRLASEMIPSRMLPRYGLFRVYREQGDSLAASVVAREALAVPMKTGNTATLRVRGEMGRYLEGAD